MMDGCLLIDSTEAVCLIHNLACFRKANIERWFICIWAWLHFHVTLVLHSARDSLVVALFGTQHQIPILTEAILLACMRIALADVFKKNRHYCRRKLSSDNSPSLVVWQNKVAVLLMRRSRIGQDNNRTDCSASFHVWNASWPKVPDTVLF